MTFLTSPPLRGLIRLAPLFLVTAPLSGAGLLRFDFNQPGAWPEASPPGIAAEAVGTIDQVDTAVRSGGLRLSFAEAPAAFLTSGLLALANTETDPAKLTLSFDYSVSAVFPVTVRIESFDAGRKRSGGLEKVLYPATATTAGPPQATPPRASP